MIPSAGGLEPVGTLTISSISRWSTGIFATFLPSEKGKGSVREIVSDFSRSLDVPAQPEGNRRRASFGRSEFKADIASEVRDLQ